MATLHSSLSYVSYVIGYPVLSLGFQTLSTPHRRLLTASPIFGLVYYLVHKLVKGPITRLGQRLLIRSSGVAFATDPENAFRAPNFERRLSSLLLHLIECAYLTWVLGDEFWFFLNVPNSLAAIGPFELSHTKYSFGIVLYMNWTLGVYLVKTFEEIPQFWNSKGRMRDVYSNIFHHILTIMMVVVSYLGKTAPFGILGSYCFLLSDISVHICRGLNDVQLKTLSGIFLIPMFLGYVATRCFIFPYYVLGNGIVSYFLMRGCGLYFREYMGVAIIFLSMVMYAYNVFWTYYIAKVVYDAIQNGMGAKLDPMSTITKAGKGEDNV